MLTSFGCRKGKTLSIDLVVTNMAARLSQKLCRALSIIVNGTTGLSLRYLDGVLLLTEFMSMICCGSFKMSIYSV